MTVYVQRDGARVVGVFANPQPGFAEEELAADHPDVLAFLDPPPDLVAYAADKRFRVETGGILLSGAPIWTDRATQAMLSRTVQLLDKGTLTAPINIKTPGGFAALSQQDVEALGAAVAQHVQAAFDAELLVLIGIENETITTTDQIDAAAWPPNG